MLTLHDMHCHLDFIENDVDVAGRASDIGSLIFSNTVTPDAWAASCKRFEGFPNVIVGFGMHPWWVDESTSVDDVLQCLESHHPRFIGEIGLDYGKRHIHTAEQQAHVFDHIVRWAAAEGDRVLSLHSVKAAKNVLDALEASGALEACTCIFHWFTGPSDQLKRAIQSGCRFSFGTRAIATKRGREYVRIIPSKQLLLETDYPPEQGRAYPFEEIRANLEEAASAIDDIKGGGILDLIAENSACILSSSATPVINHAG